MMEELKTELISLISELFNNNGFDIDIIEYADLVDDMGMDSITFISIVVEIEAKFNITVPDDLLSMDNFRKVDDIVKIVENELSLKAAETRVAGNV